MRKFVFRVADCEPHRFEREAHKMRDQLILSGFDISQQDLIMAWEAYSLSSSATWISAGNLDGDEIIDRISTYLEEVEGPSDPSF